MPFSYLLRWMLMFPVALHVSATAVSAQEAPQIQFSETTHHFGRLLQGSVANHKFTFTNAGSADLVITHVVPSCGCTTTNDWTPVVPPGGQGTIPLEFNTIGILGEIQKSLAIHTNDPAQPIVVLLLGGVVWKPIEIHPPVGVIQMPPNSSDSLSTTVRIVNQMEEPLMLQAPASTLAGLTPRIQEVTVGKEYHLVLDLQRPAEHRDLNATVTVATSSKETPQLSIPVIVIAQPEITVMPTQMFLPAVPPDVPTPYVISINNQGKDPITLGPAACDAPGSQVEIREITPGRAFELSVTFPADFGYVENQSYAITAKTSHPEFPELRVHVAFAQPPTPIRGRGPRAGGIQQ